MGARIPAERRGHWEGVYASRGPSEVSWYQARPAVSLDLIAATGAGPDAGIIDVGGGASTLVDHLLDAGYRNLAVLDVAAGALAACRARLGARAEAVEWIVADVTAWEPERTCDVWHDRAVFHFLTEAADRRAYVTTLRKALAGRGHLIVATFAPDGPPRCSGLPVVRYDAASLGAELGEGFRLVETRREEHVTPAGTVQPFLYQRYVRSLGG